MFNSISIETVVAVCDRPGCGDVALCETEMLLLCVNYPLTQVIRKIHLGYTSYHLVYTSYHLVYTSYHLVYTSIHCRFLCFSCQTIGCEFYHNYPTYRTLATTGANNSPHTGVLTYFLLYCCHGANNTITMYWIPSTQYNHHSKLLGQHHTRVLDKIGFSNLVFSF